MKPTYLLSFVILSAVVFIFGGCCNCPVGWQPDALEPIFYGYKDYTAEQAPGPVRMFFPSVDGSPQNAPIQGECCEYPLILLVHGHCTESEHYKKWFLQAAQLARAGFVVAVPEIPGIAVHPSNTPHAGLTRLEEIRTWVLNDWEYSEMVYSNTGVMGHSFGALLGARYANGKSYVKAYASLSGVWEDWPSGPLPVIGLNKPTLFVRGNDPFGDLFTNVDHFYGSLPQPKHKVIFEGGAHWDYLMAGQTTCENTFGRGECSSTPILSSELVAMFFERYLGRGSSSVDNRIPPSLIPPALTLTTEQQFFAGGNYLNYLKTTSCEISIEWQTAEGSGSDDLP